MNKVELRCNTIRNLSDFIVSLIDDAKNDYAFSVAFFKETENEKFFIVGGWMEADFAEEDRDIFCISKSNPKYVMAVKIAVNDGPYAYCDFETLNMPMYINNPDEVDDTCMILEWQENAEALAEFIYGEWERITKEHLEDDDEED